MKSRTSTGLAGLLAFSFIVTLIGCSVPATVANFALLASSPPADFPALQVKSKPVTSLVTTAGIVTWYGPGYEGDPMNGGGKYRDRGPIVIAAPAKRDRRGRLLFTKDRRHIPIVPFGSVVRLTIPNGNSILGTVRDTCSGGTWDTNRTGMQGLGFKSPMQKIEDTRVEVLY